jgi:GNAT superfamily N-acetyltransferase
MECIDPSSAVSFLKKNVYRYLAEVESLDRNVPPVPKKVFGNAASPTAILVVEEFPHGVSASIPDFDEYFVRDSLRWLADSYAQFLLSSLDRRTFDVMDRMGGFDHQPQRSRRSFVCSSLERTPARSANVSRLTRDDWPKVETYPEQRSDQPGLAQFFQWFVQDGNGAVYGARSDGDLLGYLACTNDYEGIWDVQFVHVRPERRRQGVGLRLATAYARDTLGRGHVTYWSSADNEASERTAKSAGFECCRETYWAQVSYTKTVGGVL